MNKIISIFGANGMLGRYVAKELQRYNYTRSITRASCDIRFAKPGDVRCVVNDSDVVINCAGIIKQREDISLAEMIQVNSAFPHVLADICTEKKIPMIHITTDCVFDGKQKGTQYSERSLHNALDVYGRSKSLGEPTNACVIRTSIIGEKPEDSNSLLEWAKSQTGRSVIGFVDHLWNGVTCLQLAKIIKKIVEEDLYWEGVRHIHSREATDKCNLIEWISDVYRLKLNVVPVTATDRLKAVDRRLSSIYPKMFNIPSILKQIREQKDFVI